MGSQHFPNSSSLYPLSFALKFYFCNLLHVIGTMCSVNMILVFLCWEGGVGGFIPHNVAPESHLLCFEIPKHKREISFVACCFELG
jgi:hypothetical protein